MDKQTPHKSNKAKEQERLLRQKMLGNKLREIYDEVVQEDIPEDFIAMLDNLDQQG